MSERDWDDLLEDALAGRLTAEESERFSSILAHSPEAMDDYIGQMRIHALIETHPDSLRLVPYARLEPVARPRRFGWLKLAAAAALAILFIGAASWAAVSRGGRKAASAVRPTVAVSAAAEELSETAVAATLPVAAAVTNQETNNNKGASLQAAAPSGEKEGKEQSANMTLGQKTVAIAVAASAVAALSPPVSSAADVFDSDAALLDTRREVVADVAPYYGFFDSRIYVITDGPAAFYDTKTPNYTVYYLQ